MCTYGINMKLLYIYYKLDRTREGAKAVNKF